MQRFLFIATALSVMYFAGGVPANEVVRANKKVMGADSPGEFLPWKAKLSFSTNDMDEGEAESWIDSQPQGESASEEDIVTSPASESYFTSKDRHQDWSDYRRWYLKDKSKGTSRVPMEGECERSYRKIYDTVMPNKNTIEQASESKSKVIFDSFFIRFIHLLAEKMLIRRRAWKWPFTKKN